MSTTPLVRSIGWLGEPLFWAAAMQVSMPSAVLSARALGVVRPAAAPELDRRIRRVLEWTLPGVAVALTVVLALNASAVFTTRLGASVLLLVSGLLLLGLRRRLLPPARSFLHLRAEILCLLAALSLLTLVNGDALVGTRFGRQICVVLALMFASRAVLQVVYFAPILPSGVWLRVGHCFLTAGFFALSGIYALSALGPR